MKRALLIFLASTAVALPALASPDLAKSKNCMGCHAVERKLVGPAYKDIAKRYANDPGAADMLAQRIVQGGSGVWGVIPMPANPRVSAEDAKKLAVWILEQK